MIKDKLKKIVLELILNFKQFIEKNFSSFTYFYKYLRYRLPLLLIVSIAVGFMDGLGLSMFIPLLQTIAEQSVNNSSEQMGNFSFIVDALNSVGLTLNLTVVLLTMMFFFILKGAFKWLEQYMFVIYKQYFIKKIRIDNILGLADYQYDLFVLKDAGRIQNTMSGETGRVVNAYTSYSKMMQQAVMVSTYTTLALLANAEFATLVAVGGIISNFLFRVLYKYTKELSIKVTGYNHKFQGLLIQQVASFKYLKATGLIRKYAQKLKSSVEEIEDVNKRIGIIDSAMQGVREPLMIAIVVIVILLQVHFLGGQLTTILLSILFFYRALTSVMQLQTQYNKYLSFTGSLDNIQKFSRELSRGKEFLQGEHFKNLKHTISLKDIFFSYGNTDILKNINLRIRKNETLAFVGESGSGKTTLMNIISGLLKPDSGNIFIDGKNLKDINTITYQKKIGYITQEPVIFSDTIFNNVTFWDEKNKENIEQFNESLKQASIHYFIHELPNKEDTFLGNNGINLSGGQKQRISIARELYKNIDFLFMDEATSALDSETEKTIQHNIDRLRGQYTIVIIAHRLSTVKNADRVVVMNNGVFDDVGTYNELVNRSGSFKKMVELQKL